MVWSKIIQYIALFILTVTFGNGHEGPTLAVIGFLIIRLLMFFLILNWMSKFPISYYGMYFINGMLTLISFVLILKSIIGITGVESTSSTPIAIGIFIICILPVFFWWNFNIIEYLRSRRMKTNQSNRSRKHKAPAALRK